MYINSISKDLVFFMGMYELVVCGALAFCTAVFANHLHEMASLGEASAKATAN